MLLRVALSGVKYDILFSRERNFKSLFFSQSWYRNVWSSSDQKFPNKISLVKQCYEYIERTEDRNEEILHDSMCRMYMPESLPVSFPLGTTTWGGSSWKRTETFSQGYSLASVFYCRGPAGARVFCEDFCCRVVTDRPLSAFYGTESPALNSPRNTDRTDLSKREKGMWVEKEIDSRIARV